MKQLWRVQMLAAFNTQEERDTFYTRLKKALGTEKIAMSKTPVTFYVQKDDVNVPEQVVENI